jgi:hypothetical protein
MKTTVATVWPSMKGWLLWTSDLSLAWVAVHDCLSPLPSHWLFLLGIIWLVSYLAGAAIRSESAYKALYIAVKVAFLYSLYLICVFHRPDNAIRRDFAEIRVGSSAEAVRARMSSHQEYPSNRVNLAIFDSPKGDSFRIYYYLAPDAEDACIVAFGFKDGRVIFRGIANEHLSLAFSRN